MTDWFEALKLTGGLVYLLIGGDLLVRGAISFSHRTRIPEAVVGLTIVAIGTSAPELFVSVYAALAGHSAIAIGNVVGSNVANVLLVLGVPALIYPIATKEETRLRREASYMVGVTILFVVLCFFPPFDRYDGVAMLAVLAFGLWMTYDAHTAAAPFGGKDEDGTLEAALGLPDRPWVICLFLLLGIVMLPLGADLTVDSAAALAGRFGVGEAVIGASLIAIGTSLPELSTTIIAALHRRASIALGNVIGSNVLNILAIMGITSLVADVPVPPAFLVTDLWVMSAASLLLWLIVLRGWPIARALGAGLLTSYAVYLALLYT